jgi:hypothetical protein
VGCGVAIYNGINAVLRQDLHIYRIEAVWIEILFQFKKLHVCVLYIPPDSNITSGNTWKTELTALSVYKHIPQLLQMISISIPRRHPRLIASYKAEQLSTSPTHFTEHSFSLIDLDFVNYHQNVITNSVADPFTPDLTRLHCPVVAVFQIKKTKVE